MIPVELYTAACARGGERVRTLLALTGRLVSTRDLFAQPLSWDDPKHMAGMAGGSDARQPRSGAPRSSRRSTLCAGSLGAAPGCSDRGPLVRSEMRVVDEEIAGPVLAVGVVESEAAAWIEDGIARVPDAVLLCAMRSGIGRDGRPLHWQAMPWDIGSHWSEEDQRALLADLRVLPPVPGTMPPARGPRFGDPAADSFYFGDAARR